ncbi:DUF1573 domain-containing protein [Halosquirtibacter laminarini]|uniref:DUF1573 domain-containing protein n=1 Tax=Halosquirtibacter laminarini TaxID=3374600 RepID=A0AC61NJP8_9BACT|nr:DUF1573 domain-containing protein [Prolixibacteraceae bacterium]
MKFIVNEYNFGELKINQKANYIYLFINTGNTPVIILIVKTSCGCTVPKWYKKNNHRR